MSTYLQNWAGGTIVIIGTVLLQLATQSVVTRIFARFSGERRANPRNPWTIRVLSLLTVFTLLFGHVLQVLLWTLLFLSLGEFRNLADAAYFSLASYTTVGAADLELSRAHRMLGALEAGVGVLMFGWSTAILVTLVGQTEAPERRGQDGRSDPDR
jgi:hypothetical protein